MESVRSFKRAVTFNMKGFSEVTAAKLIPSGEGLKLWTIHKVVPNKLKKRELQTKLLSHGGSENRKLDPGRSG